MSVDITKLEQITGHKFKDIGLLERSVTHRSWAYENHADESEEKLRGIENESMEFLGDSVLGLVVAEQLFEAHPDDSEGALTLMKHNIVSTTTLAKVAERLELGKYFRVGKGEEKTGGRKKQALLADTLEAVIAALFLDGGYSAARVFIRSTFAEELKAATPKNSIDFKTMLQELLQGQKLPAPTYSVVGSDGPPHERTFVVEAVWKGGKTRGSGTSIKAAEMIAAEEAYNRLKQENRLKKEQSEAE